MSTFAEILHHKLKVARKTGQDQTYRFTNGLEVRFVADPESMILTRDGEGKPAGDLEARTCGKHAGWGGTFEVTELERPGRPRALVVTRGASLL